MAKQLYVKLQTPTIELLVKAEDSSKTKAALTVGFKRYEMEQTDLKLEELQEILKEHLRLLQLRQKNTEEVSQEEINEANSQITKFIASEIVYILKAKVDVEEEGKLSELAIPDTRKAKPVEDFWESPDECLAALLEMYLASAPWRSSFVASLQAALLNSNYEEGKAKN